MIFYKLRNAHQSQCTKIRAYENAIYLPQQLQRPQIQICIHDSIVSMDVFYEMNYSNHK